MISQGAAARWYSLQRGLPGPAPPSRKAQAMTTKERTSAWLEAHDGQALHQRGSGAERMTDRLRIFDMIAEAQDALTALGDPALFVYPYTEGLYLVVRKEGETVHALTTTGVFAPIVDGRQTT